MKYDVTIGKMVVAISMVAMNTSAKRERGLHIVSSHHHFQQFHGNPYTASLLEVQAHKFGVVGCWLCMKIETAIIYAECSMVKCKLCARKSIPL